MEKEYKLILSETKNNIFKILSIAMSDKDMSATCFKLFYFICTHDKITHSEILVVVNIKTSNTISENFKYLLENDYITRTLYKNKFKKNISTYDYKINFDKINKAKNNIYNKKVTFNNPISKKINDLVYYFFRKIPTVRKYDYFSSYKAFQMMIDRDNISFSDISNIIDFISVNDDLKLSCKTPILLRKKYQKIKSLMEL